MSYIGRGLGEPIDNCFLSPEGVQHCSSQQSPSAMPRAAMEITLCHCGVFFSLGTRALSARRRVEASPYRQARPFRFMSRTLADQHHHLWSTEPGGTQGGWLPKLSRWPLSAVTTHVGRDRVTKGPVIAQSGYLHSWGGGAGEGAAPAVFEIWILPMVIGCPEHRDGP